jgi:hypothetical protein
VLRGASRIRVAFTDGTNLEGQFRALTPTHLAFRAIVRPTVQRAYFAEVAAPHDSLSRIWVRDGSHWQIGALVGGLGLGLFGFAVAMAFVGDLDSPGCDGYGCVVGATAGFGAVGAVAGGLFGALVIRWRLVWPP